MLNVKSVDVDVNPQRTASISL